MKKSVLLIGIVCGACYFNTVKAQTQEPVLAAFSVEPQKTTPVENEPKPELAAFAVSKTQTQEKEGKEVVPVLAPYAFDPPKK